MEERRYKDVPTPFLQERTIAVLHRLEKLITLDAPDKILLGELGILTERLTELIIRAPSMPTKE